MLKLKKVAVTGGLSSGKSTVCQIFQNLGAYTVSADAIVHHLLATHGPLIEALSALIGPEIVVNGQIDRSKLAEKVFHNAEALHSLETVIHPLVFQEIEREYEERERAGTHLLFIAEVPLLFETQAAKRFDATICVVASKELSLQRLKRATGLGEDEYRRRMQRQWPIERKAAEADYILSNQGDLKDLKDQVESLYQVLTAPTKSNKR